MTREEALTLALKACAETWNEKTCKQIKEALDQEPCDDAIGRQAAIRLAEQGQVQGFEWQFKHLVDLPPVTPKQRAGHWVLSRSDSGARSYQCSLCGHWHPLHDHSLGFRYCNWCGAKMEREEQA